MMYHPLSTDDQMAGQEPQRGRLRLRRSDVRHMERARNRTLRLTIVIVLAFFFCWTPYVVMVLWYQFDPEGAEHVNAYLQSSLFMFAVSNSCVNPLVYGSYTTGFKKSCYAKSCCWSRDDPSGRCSLSRQASKQTVNSWVPKTPVYRRTLLKDSCSTCSSEFPDLRPILERHESTMCQGHLELTKNTVKLCRYDINGTVSFSANHKM